MLGALFKCLELLFKCLEPLFYSLGQMRDFSERLDLVLRTTLKRWTDSITEIGTKEQVADLFTDCLVEKTRLATAAAPAENMMG